MGGVIAAVLAAALRAAAPPAGAAVWTQTTQQDFNGGASVNAAVIAAGGGAVRLGSSVDAWSVQTPLDSRDWYGVRMLPSGEGRAVGQTRLDAQGSYNVADYNGSSWTALATPGNGQDLYGVSTLDDDTGWVGGSFGRLLYFEGTESTYDEEFSSHPQDTVLYGMHILGAETGWAVGTGGQIAKYDWGWGEAVSPTGRTLYGVHTLSTEDAWAVGKQGTILRYDGSSWAAVSSPFSDDLWSVSMVSATDGWAVGDAGKILRWDGTSWTTVSSPLSDDLRSVWLASASEGWAVGYEGKLLRWDGASWTQASSPTGETLMGVSCAGPARCLAVGYAGTFLKYQRDYAAAGTLTTDSADGGGATDWGTLSWTASGLAAGQTLRFQAASSDDNNNVTDFRGPDGGTGTYYTTSGTALWSGLDGTRYLKVRAFLDTDDVQKTPVLESVSVTY